LAARGARDPPFVVPHFQQTRRVSVLLVARARAPRLEDGARRHAAHTTTRHQKTFLFLGVFLFFLFFFWLLSFALSLGLSFSPSFFLSVFYRRGLDNAKTTTQKQKTKNKKTKTKKQKQKNKNKKNKKNAE
jgi:hypothetical protein